MTIKSPFEGYNSVEQWVRHVTTAPFLTPGCHTAGGGPPPARSTFDGKDGFWVQSSRVEIYVWVPDEIAARDNSGLYQAGQVSPGSRTP
jgi:hypothetical protein